MLVFCAAVASSASAGEIGACVKKKGGKYENKTCTTAATEAKKAKYEWEPVTKPLRFVTHGGRTVFEFGKGASLSCGSFRSSGQWINAKEAEGEVLVLEFCELKRFSHVQPKLSCTSVESGLWKGKLVDHGETGLGGGEPAEGEAWIETYGEAGAPLLKITCEPVVGELTGWLRAVISPLNTALKEGNNRRKFKASFNQAFTDMGGDQFTTLTFFNPEVNELEPFGASYEGLSEVALLAKESGYLKVKLEIRA